jgi:hypothetical protein
MCRISSRREPCYSLGTTKRRLISRLLIRDSNMMLPASKYLSISKVIYSIYRDIGTLECIKEIHRYIYNTTGYKLPHDS